MPAMLEFFFRAPRNSFRLRSGRSAMPHQGTSPGGPRVIPASTNVRLALETDNVISPTSRYQARPQMTYTGSTAGRN